MPGRAWKYQKRDSPFRLVLCNSKLVVTRSRMSTGMGEVPEETKTTEMVEVFYSQGKYSGLVETIR